MSKIKQLAVGLARGCVVVSRFVPVWLSTKPEAAEVAPRTRDAAVRERERRALTEFYEALGGPDWMERDFWASDRTGKRVARRDD